MKPKFKYFATIEHGNGPEQIDTNSRRAAVSKAKASAAQGKSAKAFERKRAGTFSLGIMYREIWPNLSAWRTEA